MKHRESIAVGRDHIPFSLLLELHLEKVSGLSKEQGVGLHEVVIENHFVLKADFQMLLIEFLVLAVQLLGMVNKRRLDNDEAMSPP